MMSLNQMEEVVDKLEEGLEVMKRRAEKAERLAAERERQQNEQSYDESPIDDDDEEDDAGNTAARLDSLNRGGKRKTSKDDDTSGGDNEAARRHMSSKLEKIVAKAANTNYNVGQCLEAVEKNYYGSVTKADFAAALDTLTHTYMRERGKTNFAKSYSRVLDTEEGKLLYKGYVESQGTDVPENAYDEDIRKLANRPPASCDDDLPHQCLAAISKGQRVSKKDLESALDALAMAQVSKSGQTFYQAYSKVLNTPAGAALMQKLDDVIRYGG